MSDEIVNKIAAAQIEQIDLASFLNKELILEIDLNEQLWNEMVLKEKDFRNWIKEHDWDQYKNQIVIVFCSNDAIIPAWAFMLITSSLSAAKEIICGDRKTAEGELFFANLENWKIEDLADKRVMVKGCSNIPNPNKAYTDLTKKLIPVVKSLMFGEPCSAVPVYKKK